MCIGAFLIPYFTMVLLVAVPLFFLESAVGQFSSLGAAEAFRISPIFRGVGYATIVGGWFVSLYYSTVIAECVYFLFASFSFPELPWAHCDPAWATGRCREFGAGAVTLCSSLF